jgi:hypothetical protein
MILAAIALGLVELTGPGGQVIEVNPNEIVSVREPRGADHFGKDVHCLVFTSDGKYIGVVQTCEQVKAIVDGGKG